MGISNIQWIITNKYITKFSLYYRLPKTRLEKEKEEYRNMDPSFRCPLHLLEILRYQTKLSDPSVHVRYMKFRQQSTEEGFIGRRVFMVRTSFDDIPSIIEPKIL